jgi:hypothetical protein
MLEEVKGKTAKQKKSVFLSLHILMQLNVEWFFSSRILSYSK